MTRSVDESADPGGPGPSGLRIGDLAGLVVGYGLASVLVRSFWGRVEPGSIPAGVALAVVYAWLGLAMGGPVVLLLDRRPGPTPPPGPPSTTEPPGRYSPEETAWMVIGGYFIALALFVVPARNRETPWSMVLVVQAVVAAVLFAWLPFSKGRKKPRPAGDRPRWTRRAALLVLWAWPPAWIGLALLFR